MKKLMIAVAIVCAATMSQAAKCAWNSGTIYAAKSANDGSFDTSKTFTTVGDVQCVIWEIASATAFDNLQAGDLFASYKAETTGSLITGAQVYTAQSSPISTIMKTGTKSYDSGTDVYAAILYTYKDANGNEFYIENFAEQAAKSGTATVSDLAVYNGGSIGGEPQGTALTGWTVASVPEPTSGLLLLLGMAGLALRRRRA